MLTSGDAASHADASSPKSLISRSSRILALFSNKIELKRPARQLTIVGNSFMFVGCLIYVLPSQSLRARLHFTAFPGSRFTIPKNDLIESKLILFTIELRK